MMTNAFAAPRFRFVLTIILVICTVGLAATFINWTVDQINLSNNGQPDFNTLPQENVKKGLFVTGMIDLAIGPFAEEYYTSNDSTPVSDYSKDFYYLVPVFTEDGYTVDYMISYKADISEDKSAMNAIAEWTLMDVAEPPPLVVENGLIYEFDGELQRIMETWVTTPDFYDGGSFIDYCVEYNVMGTTDKDSILARILPYYFDRLYHAGVDPADMLYWAVPGATTLCLILILRAVDRRRMEEAARRMAEQQRYSDPPPM